ncbi:MAG: DUF3786 domain-containing protein [Aigarchaeota archaeon]|nr:DUF3786 domain-containing protein [Aigarchaeota archaeon]MDW8021119.1 DUF3786 domain-containing protein [Nitrososphaerota archaeon]
MSILRPPGLPTKEDYKTIFQELLKMDGEEAAKRCGVIFLPSSKPGKKRGRYVVNLLVKTYSVELDSEEVIDLVAGKEAPNEIAFLVLKYLSSSAGVGRKEDWIPFDEFPRAKLYKSYFVRYVLNPFARTFGYDPEKYELVCRRLGGKKEKLGGLSYSFSFLPRVRVLTQLWRGRKEDYVSPTSNMMFNFSAKHFFSAEDLFLAGRVMISIMEAEAKKL